ncbi:hypothetical protein [Alkalihalobacillus deserti]|uniref:hypothetical protein n=1 Tax=Alkalihalobacillus deserti TaxID=2879466 RepID=UPI001D1536A9|nr:hypothetical protein [Alkalihalobacillus deserti]
MLKWIVAVFIVIGLVGFFGYQFVISKGSNLLVDRVVNQINNDELQQLIDDPTFQAFTSNVDVNTDKDLPFETKEEALKVVLKEFSMSEITDVATKAQKGEINVAEVEALLQERFTEEEIEALKIIAIKEIQAKQSK